MRQRLAHGDDRVVEVQAGPLQPEALTLPHAGSQGQRVQSREPVILDSFEARPRFLEREGLGFELRDVAHSNLHCRVVFDESPFLGLAHCSVEDAFGGGRIDGLKPVAR